MLTFEKIKIELILLDKKTLFKRIFFMEILHISPSCYTVEEKNEMIEWYAQDDSELLGSVEFDVVRDGVRNTICVRENRTAEVLNDMIEFDLSLEEFRFLLAKAEPFFELMNGKRNDIEAVVESAYA